MSNSTSTERKIDVAVCTFRRPSVEQTLQSIAEQQLLPGDAVRVIVADNDLEPSARVLIEAAADRLSLDCVYVHAPARNISIARNACLDHAKAAYVAFIDDDEIASPNWLSLLLDALIDSGADATLGPAIAQYAADAPEWMKRANLHSTYPVIKKGNTISTGYTCNVLIRMTAFQQMRFDPRLGRTGGEDDVFFSNAVHHGARIVYAPEAIVYDPVPAGRASLRWLARRAFRNGQTHARIAIERGGNRAMMLAIGLAKAATCLAVAVVTIPFPVRWRKAYIRGTLHVGACARYLGKKEIILY